MSSLILYAAAQAHVDDLRRHAARRRADRREIVGQSLIHRSDRRERPR